MQINFAKLEAPEAGVLVVGVAENKEPAGLAAALDKKTKGANAKALATMRFTGRRNQLVEVLSPAGLDLDRVLVVGLGAGDSFNGLAAESVGATAIARLLTSGQKDVTFAVEPPEGAKIDGAQTAAHIALGCSLRGYRFDNYRTTLKKNEKPSLAKV